MVGRAGACEERGQGACEAGIGQTHVSRALLVASREDAPVVCTRGHRPWEILRPLQALLEGLTFACLVEQSHLLPAVRLAEIRICGVAGLSRLRLARGWFARFQHLGLDLK